MTKKSNLKILAGISIVSNQILLPILLISIIFDFGIGVVKTIVILLIALLIPSIHYWIKIIRYEYSRNHMSVKLVLLILFPFIFLWSYSKSILKRH